MTAPQSFQLLSWSAIWTGFHYLEISPRPLQAKAEAELSTAQGTTLIWLTELVLGQNVHEQVRHLAEAEKRLPEQAYREWRLYHLRLTLERLCTTVFYEDNDYDFATKLGQLNEFWRLHGWPADHPSYDTTVNPYEPERWNQALATHLLWLADEEKALLP